MGIFRKKSEEEKRLMVLASSVASAIAKSSNGMMPPDFADDVISGSREEMAELYRVVLQQSGVKAAEKASVKHAEMAAGIWAEQTKMNVVATRRRVSEVVRQLVQG